MIELNLLSPTQKEALRARVLYAMIERLMVFLTIETLLAGVILLGVRIRLLQTLETVVSRQILSTEYVSANNEIRTVNETVGRIEAVQALAVPASTLLSDVVGRTPGGIIVTGLDFETRTNALRIAGVAETREKLLAYEASLRSSPYVKTLESPISNLLKKRDVNFQFQAVLNSDALRRTLDPEKP